MSSDMIRSLLRVFSFVLLPAFVASSALAQSADVPIEHYRISFDDPQVLQSLTALRDSHKLMSMDEVHRALQNPTPVALQLPSPSSQVRTSAQIAVLARKGLVRIGWFYQSKSGAWHENVADGYALTSDGAVATCYHCLQPPKGSTFTEGYLFAANPDSQVFAVEAVLAADQALDTAIVRIIGGNFTPIALNDQVAPGDPVYLLSDPGETAGYFSSGQINRFFWARPGKHDRDTLDGARSLRINVSTDWSPGSSGAAVLDACGNAIGHVDMISTLNRATATAPESPTTEPSHSQTQNQAPATYVVLHEAVPARGVLLLVESMNSPVGKVSKP
jgi:Trypsin-like peptidase domain